MSIQTLKGLNYKKSIHKYVLDKDYFSERTSVTLENVLSSEDSGNIFAVVEAYLTRASIVLYSYIYSLNPDNKDYLEYRLCHEKKLVEMIREALIEMVNYWVLNGIDATIINPILNIDVQRTAPVLTKEQLELAQIPLSVKNILSSGKFGIRWIEKYDPKIFDEYEIEESLLGE